VEQVEHRAFLRVFGTEQARLEPGGPKSSREGNSRSILDFQFPMDRDQIVAVVSHEGNLRTHLVFQGTNQYAVRACCLFCGEIDVRFWARTGLRTDGFSLEVPKGKSSLEPQITQITADFGTALFQRGRHGRDEERIAGTGGEADTIAPPEADEWANRSRTAAFGEIPRFHFCINLRTCGGQSEGSSLWNTRKL
jgi:hypothetical protein